MSLTKATFSMINNAPLNLADYGAVGDGVTDDRIAIQAALDARTNNVTIVGGGKSYRITGSIYIRGNNKTLDFQGGSLILDVSTTNQQAVVMDNPTVTKTQFPALKNVSIYATASTQAQTDCTGIVIENGVLNPITENVYIERFGWISLSGTGMVIQGGPIGGDDTPYYGLHTNLKISFCNVGLFVGANIAYPIITTHTFINPTIGGCKSHGAYFYNAQSCTMICPQVEFNQGSNVRLEECGEIYIFGGFNEGGTPNVEYINTNPNFSNIVLANMYPSAGDTGTTASTYAENPALALQSNIVNLNRIGSTQLTFLLNEVVQLSSGTATFYSEDGRFARFLLLKGTVTILETSGASTGDWSTTKDSAGKLNVYFESGAYFFQNKNGGNFFRIHIQQGF